MSILMNVLYSVTLVSAVGGNATSVTSFETTDERDCANTAKHILGPNVHSKQGIWFTEGVVKNSAGNHPAQIGIRREVICIPKLSATKSE